ncbi:hypothetical protein HYT17_01950 [Candidatus Microgenomates bacterium]|nr:hypothetical protein [Candidatus Microgenomates bacterium]
MILEAGPRSPEIIAAQQEYGRVVLDCFVSFGLQPEHARLELAQMEARDSVPTIEFSISGDRLPTDLQQFVDDVFQGMRFNKIRVVAGLHQAALIGTTVDGQEATYHAVHLKGDGKITEIGNEISLGVDDPIALVELNVSAKQGHSWEPPQPISTSKERIAISSSAIKSLAKLIDDARERGDIKAVTYPRKNHPDLPRAFGQ